MDVFDKALIFAVKAHGGKTRKVSHLPYILHPAEVAAIAGTMTGDREVIAAAALHDVVEDTGVTAEEIEREFGARVAALVASETEDKMTHLPPEATWRIRKETSLKDLRDTDDDAVRIVWLSDKLSNMRSFYRQFLESGDAMWNNYNQKDPANQAWYYRTIAKYTSQLSSFPAWEEYNSLVEKVFRSVKNEER